jgi:hypothetical protein
VCVCVCVCVFVCLACVCIAIFLKIIGSGTYSDTIFGRRGRGVISMPEEKVPERIPDLRPSEKELPARRFCAFRHKILKWAYQITSLCVYPTNNF